MPIPPYSIDGILPPFTGSSGPGGSSEFMSPYKVTVSEVVSYFSTSDERRAILIGWLKYRAELRRVGIVAGFQWLDGSFVEEKEQIRGEAPNDLDLVVFFRRPAEYQTDEAFQQLVGANFALFRRDSIKASYHLDAFLVDLNGDPEAIVSQTRYFLQLFSHQRNTNMWKGMLQVRHDDQDEAALLARLAAELSGERP